MADSVAESRIFRLSGGAGGEIDVLSVLRDGISYSQTFLLTVLWLRVAFSDSQAAQKVKSRHEALSVLRVGFSYSQTFLLTVLRLRVAFSDSQAAQVVKSTHFLC
ncbi:hypothetical protein SAMN05428962_2642 [Paenibacillus sp. BC26]|nr:hypothetical protein SAMN05428962_2642 [Paenibacillus sp. BC26]